VLREPLTADHDERDSGDHAVEHDQPRIANSTATTTHRSIWVVAAIGVPGLRDAWSAHAPAVDQDRLGEHPRL
jgi:hypothetical protein